MIDVIDTAFLAQNDAGGMAVFNELALAMAGGGEGALESALRGHAADRGDDLTLGQLLRDALHGGASLGSMATLDVLGGLRAVDSGGGGGELATMSFFYSDGGDGDGGSDDVDGDGQPDEPIPVTGKRPNDVDEDDDDGGWLPPSGGGDGGEDTGGDGPGGGGLIGEDGDDPDCRDRNAGEAQDKINSDSNKNYYEHGVIIYVDSTGAVRQSSVIQGNTTHITTSAIQATMQQDGIEFSQVIGFVHNHPEQWYGGYNAPVNRYPSGGDVAGGDRNNADWFVGNGAGGVDGSNFALYVIDTEGKMREFEYADREIYKNLDAEERRAGESLPGQVQTDGSCG